MGLSVRGPRIPIQSKLGTDLSEHCMRNLWVSTRETTCGQLDHTPLSGCTLGRARRQGRKRVRGDAPEERRAFTQEDGTAESYPGPQLSILSENGPVERRDPDPSGALLSTDGKVQ